MIWSLSRPTSRPTPKRADRIYLIIDIDSESAGLDDALIEGQSKFDGIHVVEISVEAPALEFVKIYGRPKTASDI